MQFTINASRRTQTGSGASRRLRRSGGVPAIVYGGDKVPEMLELDHNEILHALGKEAFHASVLDLVVDKKKQSVLLRDAQMHPYKQLVQHVDFMRVDAKSEISVSVPLHFLNQETAPGVKLHHGLVSQILTEVEVLCLPKDLPQFIEVDLGGLEVGQSIHVNELKLPDGVSLTQHGDQNQVVVSIVARRGAGTSAGADEEGEGEQVTTTIGTGDAEEE